jgi:mannitol-specific phosphotransferase system IIBC component
LVRALVVVPVVIAVVVAAVVSVVITAIPLVLVSLSRNRGEEGKEEKERRQGAGDLHF